MNSVKYLIELQEQQNLTNAATARMLNMTEAAISHYKHGRRIMDEETCLAVALALNIDPMQVIMAAGIDRAAKSGTRSLWQVFIEKAAATAATVVLATAVNLFLTPHNAEASTYTAYSPAESSCLYIM